MANLTDEQLKEIAKDILIVTAFGNYEYGLEVEAEENDLDEEQIAHLEKLVDNAKIEVSWLDLD